MDVPQPIFRAGTQRRQGFGSDYVDVTIDDGLSVIEPGSGQTTRIKPADIRRLRFGSVWGWTLNRQHYQMRLWRGDVRDPVIFDARSDDWHSYAKVAQWLAGEVEAASGPGALELGTTRGASLVRFIPLVAVAIAVGLSVFDRMADQRPIISGDAGEIFGLIFVAAILVMIGHDAIRSRPRLLKSREDLWRHLPPEDRWG